MSTITAILDAQPDGSLHVPLPAELRHGRVRINAHLEAVDALPPTRLRATPEMVERRRKALAELRALGGLSDIIPDALKWQREQRVDRSLPGRD